MDIADLTADEDLALLGLLREIIRADAEYTDREREKMQTLRTVMGPVRFDAAIRRVEDLIGNRDELKSFVKTITRQDARELIFELLEGVAASDGVESAEERPLRWLASWWDIKR